MSLGLGLNIPNLYLELGVFSHGYQLFDEILDRAFIRIFGRLTYAERRGRLATGVERIA